MAMLVLDDTHFIRSDSVDQKTGWIFGLGSPCSQKQALMAYLEALGRNSPSRFSSDFGQESALYEGESHFLAGCQPEVGKELFSS